MSLACRHESGVPGRSRWDLAYGLLVVLPESPGLVALHVFPVAVEFPQA